ncbi:putative shikimate kinase [Gluconacetobacter sacchari DSM 12717]|uniref:2-epi-5-epi-valiolone synthase n=2 Tax=Gluconacetobacter sacchari TaxID=92759 RepID=A0A7W4IDB5_9PROT|nr:2-epi-5-epi-valiolone synthase [Gluconacetobacter sacchari]MBB2160657.1 2-epi-5-epi-valiolone synthase [Gluconacetobacter sacchari]GBQ22014.1 putative shikimate kinase [Gluconacetobacter sacchari DSM 12717]
MSTSHKLNIKADQVLSYDIATCHSTDEIVSSIRDCITSLGGKDEPFIIFMDEGLPEAHRKIFLSTLEEQDIRFSLTLVPGDEDNKTLEYVLKVVDQLNAASAKRRSTPPIVIGGGVVLDVVGMAASIYRRGIPFIRIPTTLLAMVDVGVAAKTAVNHLGYRNRLGTFHPAVLTVIFQGYLDTLPVEHISNGLGEIFKLALIKDRVLFDLISEHGNTLLSNPGKSTDETDEIIIRSLEGMAVELESNLWESELKRVVDFGHTFGPLVEMSFVPDLFHGKAVALDCLLSLLISANRGMLEEVDVESVFEVAKKLGLADHHPGFDDVDLLWRSVEDATLHRNGHQNLPLMTGIGCSTFIQDLTKAEVAKASAQLGSRLRSPGVS